MSGRVSDTAGLREIYRQPSKLAANKTAPAIDAEAARFLAASPLCVLATHGPSGTDASPRGGPPGFARVLDGGTRLAFGDLSGNNRLDSYTNLVENSQVGLIFLVPGTDHTVRVNGAASLTTDPDICKATTIGERMPKAAVVIDVEECFVHCAKALLRAGIWDTSTWPAADVPTLGDIIANQHELGLEPGDVDRNVEANYSKTMWESGGS